MAWPFDQNNIWNRPPWEIQIQNLEGQVNGLQQALNHSNQSLQQTQQELDQMRRERNSAQVQLSQLGPDHHRLRQENSRLRQERDEARSQLRKSSSSRQPLPMVQQQQSSAAPTTSQQRPPRWKTMPDLSGTGSGLELPAGSPAASLQRKASVPSGPNTPQNTRARGTSSSGTGSQNPQPRSAGKQPLPGVQVSLHPTAGPSTVQTQLVVSTKEMDRLVADLNTAYISLQKWGGFFGHSSATYKDLSQELKTACDRLVPKHEVSTLISVVGVRHFLMCSLVTRYFDNYYQQNKLFEHLSRDEYLEYQQIAKNLRGDSRQPISEVLQRKAALFSRIQSKPNFDIESWRTQRAKEIAWKLKQYLLKILSKRITDQDKAEAGLVPIIAEFIRISHALEAMPRLWTWNYAHYNQNFDGDRMTSIAEPGTAMESYTSRVRLAVWPEVCSMEILESRTRQTSTLVKGRVLLQQTCASSGSTDVHSKPPPGPSPSRGPASGDWRQSAQG
jgi:hypothetical protein